MSNPRVSLLAAAATTAFVLGLAACGDDEEEADRPAATGTQTAPAKPAGRPVARVSVSETDFRLKPANPRIDKPGVVEFRATNDGEATHALEVEGPKGEVETKDLAPGESATLRADLGKPGTYTWYCPVGNHRELGMRGKITVARGGGGGASASGQGSGGSSPGY
jgi:plastocyanin